MNRRVLSLSIIAGLAFIPSAHAGCLWWQGQCQLADRAYVGSASPAYSNAFNQLIPTGALAAQQAGYTGAGVKVALIGGSDPADVTLNGALNGGHDHVVYFHNYTQSCASSSSCDPGKQIVTDNGHDGAVAELVAGDSNYSASTGRGFAGGVAPDALLYEFDVCDTSGCVFPPQSANDPVINDMVSHGVQVVVEPVESGDVNLDYPPSAYTGYYNSSKALMAGGVLQVISTGDLSGDKHVGILAGLPYYFSDIQQGIIAASGVDIDSSGNPILAASDSTPCNEAAQWCLVAPVQVYNMNSPLGSGDSWRGSSESAPIIGGVAALVLQAFPWMGPAQVQDTLLTTATFIDDGSHQRVNATFGWGMVNAAKAVYGPSQFAFPQFGPFLAPVPAGINSVFANAISGPGGLKVNGAGTLTLSNANTYTGATEVASGTLAVNGSITSPVTVDAGGVLTVNGSVAGSVLINAGGNLDGIGAVNADVTNNGTVTSQGGGAAQGLTINGNLTDGASSTTMVALGNPLQVKGTANVAGTMNVLNPPIGYAYKSIRNLLTAGAVNGTFGNLTFASSVFYTGTLSYTGTQVSLSLAQVSVTRVVVPTLHFATPQTITAADNVQRALDVSNNWFVHGQTSGHEAWFADAGRFLSSPNGALAAASLNSLSGEIYATSRAVEAQQSLATDSAVANRQRALALDGQAGVWAQALGADGTLARNGYDATDYRAGGMLVGMDGQFGSGFSGGVAGGRTRAWTDMAGLGGRIDAREDVAAAYAQWTGNSGWYAAARLSYAHVRNGVNRDLLLGSSLTPLAGEHTDHVSMATLEGGKTIALGAASLTPYAAMTSLRLHQSGFTEQGSAMGLAAPSQSHNAVLGTLGLRYGKGFDWALGHSVLEGYAAYRRVFRGADLGMQASFVGIPDSTFTAQGQNLPRNLGILGVHWSTQVNQRWGWFLDADYQSGSEGAHQAELNTGIKVTF